MVQTLLTVAAVIRCSAATIVVDAQPVALSLARWAIISTVSAFGTGTHTAICWAVERWLAAVRHASAAGACTAERNVPQQ